MASAPAPPAQQADTADLPQVPSSSDDDVPFTTPVFYEGADESCTLCLENFRHGDRVCRLMCRHVFHTDCWG
eukprot:2970485-Lingulodinium_polyedra.AAC.1